MRCWPGCWAGTPRIVELEEHRPAQKAQAGNHAGDEYIDNYCKTIERLGQAGVKVICYNFMPVFDWTRSDLFKPRADGATVLAYDQAVIDKITDPQDFADRSVVAPSILSESEHRRSRRSWSRCFQGWKF